MKKRDHILFGVAVLAVLLVTLTGIVQAQDIAVYVDNRPVFFDVPPAVIQGRTMVPLRGVFEQMGATVDYNPATRVIRSTRGETTVQLTLGSRAAFVNNQQVFLDVPPMIVQGRTLVPLRFVGEALGGDVRWVPATRTVAINTTPIPEPPPATPPPPVTPTPPVTPPPPQVGQVFEGTVVNVSPTAAQQSITIQEGANRYTFQVTPQTTIYQVETGGTFAGFVNLRQIQPGSEAVIRTVPNNPSLAARIEDRFMLVQGTVARRTTNQIILTDGTTIVLNPGIRIVRNNQQVPIGSIRVGEQVQLRLNPRTSQAWWAFLEQPDQQPVGVITRFTHNATRVLRPGMTVRFRLEGTPGGAAYYTIPGLITRQPMQEIASGVYEGTYIVRNTDPSINIRPVGTLDMPFASPVNQVAANPIVIRTGVAFDGNGNGVGIPGAPVILQPADNQLVDAPFIVSGQARPFSTVVIRVEPTVPVGPIGAGLRPIERQIRAGADGSFQTSFNFLVRPAGTIYTIRAHQVTQEGTSPVTVIQARQR